MKMLCGFNDDLHYNVTVLAAALRGGACSVAEFKENLNIMRGWTKANKSLTVTQSGEAWDILAWAADILNWETRVHNSNSGRFSAISAHR